MFISKPDIESLTGYKSWRHQVVWLAEAGYRFSKRKNGSPAVLKIEVERILLGGEMRSDPLPDYTRFIKSA